MKGPPSSLLAPEHGRRAPWEGHWGTRDFGIPLLAGEEGQAQGSGLSGTWRDWVGFDNRLHVPHTQVPNWYQETEPPLSPSAPLPTPGLPTPTPKAQPRVPTPELKLVT